MIPERLPLHAPLRTPLRLLLVDSHASVREGLRTLLSDEPDLRVVAEAPSVAAALACAGAVRPHVILLDTAIPDGGPDTVRRLRVAAPGARVLVLTGLATGADVRAAVAAGATGYLLKDVLWGDLGRAIRRAAAGRPVFHPSAEPYLQPVA